MKSITRWLIVILIAASVLFSACAQVPKAAGNEKPSKLEEIAGSEFKKVILTEKAAERIGVETTQISEMAVDRKLTIGGEVVEPMSTRSIGGAKPNAKAWIRVHLEEDDLDDIDLDEEALILPLSSDAGFTSLSAYSVEVEDNDDGEDEDEEGSRFFGIDDDDTGLVAGQRVFVKLPMVGSGSQQKIIPFAALIYGINGETWVYTNPEPLVFVRAPVTVDYIDEDLAFLSEGPDVGTEVVTIGGSLLYGAETGVSK